MSRSSSWFSDVRGRLHALPDFLLVGTQKGGTTSLYRYLAAHPDVLSPSAKEPFFFDRRFARGVGWYRAWFPTHAAVRRRAARAPGPVLTGEASTTYLDHPAVPARAASVVPGARIIALLRDPTERAISHYFHNRRKGREPLAPLDAFRAENARVAGEVERALEDPGYASDALAHAVYLRRGQYAEHLARWHAAYPEARVLVLESEALFVQPAATFERVRRFLGLAEWAPEAFPVHNLGSNRESVSPEARALLDAHFEPHNRRLAAMLGRELSWT